MVPSEPLVLGLGLAMLLVSIGCLLEHMAATMPLLLRAAWAARGVHFNISPHLPTSPHISPYLPISPTAFEAEVHQLQPNPNPNLGPNPNLNPNPNPN